MKLALFVLLAACALVAIVLADDVDEKPGVWIKQKKVCRDVPKEECDKCCDENGLEPKGIYSDNKQTCTCRYFLLTQKRLPN